MLPPNGKRIRFYFLCGRCGMKVGLSPAKVGVQIGPVTYDPAADVKMRQLPPGDRL